MVDKITKETFQKLFLPLELESWAVHYEFSLQTKNCSYTVKYNKTDGNNYRRKGRGWLVSKLSNETWNWLRTTKEERETVIDYCRKFINRKGDIRGI